MSPSTRILGRLSGVQAIFGHFSGAFGINECRPNPTFMKTENVLYTDGHQVTVTDSALVVKKKWYSLDGITKHGFSILQPVRLPAIFSLTAGLLLTIAGAARLITMDLTGVFGVSMDVNKLAVGVGTLLLLLGAAWLWSMSERYAVNITTADGDKNVIISKRKEYVSRIVHALNEAFFARVNSETKQQSTRGFMVSGR